MIILTLVLLLVGIYILLVAGGKFCYFIYRQRCCKTDVERLKCIKSSQKFVETVNLIAICFVYLGLISVLVGFIIIFL